MAWWHCLWSLSNLPTTRAPAWFCARVAGYCQSLLSLEIGGKDEFDLLYLKVRNGAIAIRHPANLDNLPTLANHGG